MNGLRLTYQIVSKGYVIVPLTSFLNLHRMIFIDVT